METYLPNIVAYVSDVPLRAVSSSWKYAIDLNNKAILDGVANRYPHAKSIQEALEEAIRTRDLNTIISLTIEYKGFLPIDWNKLIPMINDVDILNIIANRIRYGDDMMRLHDRIRRIIEFSTPRDSYLHIEVLDLANIGRLYMLDQLNQRVKNEVAKRLIENLSNLFIREDPNTLFQRPTSRNHFRLYLLSELQEYADMFNWLKSNGYIDQDSILNDAYSILIEIIHEKKEPYTGDKLKKHISFAAKDEQMDILDRYANMNNIISIIVDSYDNGIPPMMRLFLQYKGDEWNIPLYEYMSNAIDNTSIGDEPPSNLWKKILATAAHNTGIGDQNALNLAYHMIDRYRPLISERMKHRIMELSGYYIHI